MTDPFTLFYPSNATTTTTLTSTIAIHQGTHGVVSALPPSLSLFSLIVTIASILLCSVIAMYFYRSYRFSGFGYLLGLPTGFAILAASFVFEHLHVVYSYSYTNESLENLFFWIQLSLQSEGFAFIALSYMLKNRDGSTSTINGLLPTASKILFSPHNWIHSSIKIREIIVSVLPMILISIPLMVTISALFVQPILNETELKDMSLYTTLFDIVVLGYIFVKCVKPLLNADNLQLFYEILCAIEDDIDHNKVARPTHIQHNCRLSYDKMMNHFKELGHRYMIYRDNSTGLISITSKGKKFVKQYNELINLIESAGL